ARIRGARGHLAQHESAVGSAQRAHAEAIEDLAVRKTPVAPGEEACEIGFEIAQRQPPAGEVGVAAEQHAAVPEAGLLMLLRGEMRVDLGASFMLERPRPLFQFQVERGDAVDEPLHVATHLAFIPVVFLACSTNLLVKVLLTSIFALATSGLPWLNTAST